jgi:hypothetical protein
VNRFGPITLTQWGYHDPILVPPGDSRVHVHTCPEPARCRPAAYALERRRQFNLLDTQLRIEVAHGFVVLSRLEIPDSDTYRLSSTWVVNNEELPLAVLDHGWPRAAIPARFAFGPELHLLVFEEAWHV